MPRSKNECPHCAYDMTNVPRCVCPECGLSINSPPASPKIYRNGHALWIAMVLSAAALFVYQVAMQQLSTRAMKTGDVITHGILVLNIAGICVMYLIWWVNARDHKKNVYINRLWPTIAWVLWAVWISIFIL